MKKYIYGILAIVLLCSCLLSTSCGQTNSKEVASEMILLDPYTAYGSTDVSESAESPTVYANTLPEEWTKGVDKYIDEKAAKVFSADLFGQTYTHEYTSSLERTLLTSPVGNRTIHTYGNTLEGFLSVDAETKQVVKWSAQMPAPDVFDRIFQSDSNGDIIYTIEPEELKQKAENYAKELVAEEQLSKYEYVHTDENRIYFYRMINGHKTNEYIHLWFQSDGAIAGFDMRNIGLYNKVDSFKFDEKKAEDLINEQIKEYFADKEHKINETNIEVIMLPSEQLAYKYVVTVHYCIGEEENENGETVYVWSGETLEFTIPAE